MSFLSLQSRGFLNYKDFAEKCKSPDRGIFGVLGRMRSPAQSFLFQLLPDEAQFSGPGNGRETDAVIRAVLSEQEEEAAADLAACA